MKSKFLTLNGTDFIKGLVVTMFSAILLSIANILAMGTFPNLLQLKAIGFSALSAGIAYIVKNLFTNSQDQLFTAEPKVIAKKSA